MKIRHYSANRFCQHDGCLVRLSIYNPDDYCNKHSGRMTIAEQRAYMYSMTCNRGQGSRRPVYRVGK